MKLAYKEMGSGKPLIILHGLFGSADNWQTLGKKLSEDFHVFLVDQRNHGHSPHDDEHNFEVMADDLEEFLKDRKVQDKIILAGHSMGGKTAIAFAAKFPERLEKLVVIDIGTKQYPVHHEEIFNALNSMQVDQYKSRGEANDEMEIYLSDQAVRQFLLKSLYWKKPGELSWRFNVKALDNNINRIMDPIHDKIDVPVLFIRGTKSGYIKDKDVDSLKKQFAQFSMADINAGHWIHAEAPDEFYNVLNEYILS